jgi:hypothetical protein
MTLNPPREKEKCVALPDELWANLLEVLPGAAKGIETYVRLFSGEVIERLVISNRGYILGREAAGLAGYHGTIDNSMLTFSTEDIEAVQVPAFRFWQRPKWVALNPQHPARRAWQERAKR